jgi:chromosome segregation ATPase
MILTEKEINNMPVNLDTLWLVKKSHIEALDKIKALDPYYYISKWEYYEDRADQFAVIADALANALEETKAKLQELENEISCLEMRMEDCRLKAEGVISYIHEAKDEDNGDEKPEQAAQLFDEAEAAYQAALKAAKEEL